MKLPQMKAVLVRLREILHYIHGIIAYLIDWGCFLYNFGRFCIELIDYSYIAICSNSIAVHGFRPIRFFRENSFECILSVCVNL